jgi:hypothetical protein
MEPTPTQPNSIGQLAKALAMAQGEFKPIVKDKVVKSSSYSYRYADLASVREAVTSALTKNGLAVIQTFRPNGGVHQYVDTLLVHSSGESISSSYQIPATGKQQEIGSAITYARRYSLCAILGVVAEDDDDGNAADQKQVKVEQTVSTQAAGKLDAIAGQKSTDYEMLDPMTGEIEKYKLGTDWLIKAQEHLHQHPAVHDWWAANHPTFHRIEKVVTDAKHKKGIDMCARTKTLATARTATPEIRP